MAEEPERNWEGREAAFPDVARPNIKPLHRVGADSRPHLAQTTFDRHELSRILTTYGRMVAVGEWRDYALDFLADAAVFSIFRRASEMPLYRIEKRPRLKNRQGQYSVIAHGGLVLKRGHDLAQVLKVFDKAILKALTV
jgi:hypothetical protein